MLRFAIISSKNNGVYKDIIDKVMINYDMFYEKCSFNANDKKFEEFCTANDGAAVILIEDGKLDSLNILNDIRKKYNCYASFIIIIDTDKKLNGIDILENNPFLVDIIDVSLLNTKLEKNLCTIMNIIYNKKKVFSFYSDKILYKIPYSQILYIEKELNGKKVSIVCKQAVYEISKSIVEMEKLLDNRFVKSHQSALINKDNIDYIDFNSNKIVFENSKECNLISRTNKKNLRDSLSK